MKNYYLCREMNTPFILIKYLLKKDGIFDIISLEEATDKKDNLRRNADKKKAALGQCQKVV